MECPESKTLCDYLIWIGPDYELNAIVLLPLAGDVLHNGANHTHCGQEHAKDLPYSISLEDSEWVVEITNNRNSKRWINSPEGH